MWHVARIYTSFLEGMSCIRSCLSLLEMMGQLRYGPWMYEGDMVFAKEG